MQTKATAVSILAAAVFIGGAMMLLSSSDDSNTGNKQATNNVSVVSGKQIITISAKGGYSPKVTTAKADTPTVLQMNTRGTFDCSSTLTIPSLSYHSNLPPSGETLIDVPPQKAGTVMRGLCAMGMYHFTVNFN